MALTAIRHAARAVTPGLNRYALAPLQNSMFVPRATLAPAGGTVRTTGSGPAGSVGQAADDQLTTSPTAWTAAAASFHVTPLTGSLPPSRLFGATGP